MQKGFLVLGGVSLMVIVAAAALLFIPRPAPLSQASIPDIIEVTAPAIGARVSSPLVATGRARGNWYFEASFGAVLRDHSGAVLARGYAQAQSDWMTGDFVPFATIPLVFPPQPAGSTGTLILSKDNPSGLPENDQALSIPVTF
jgi:hypothetical protein